MMIIISVIFSIIELTFPIWGIIVTMLLSKRGIIYWKAWGIVSSLFVVEVYLVGTYIGYNLGTYFFIFLSAIPDILYVKATRASYVYRSELDVWFWILPPLILLIIPMMLLFVLSKIRGKLRSS
jgi:hypothetical protein